MSDVTAGRAALRLDWRVILGFLLVIVLFVPIRRYSIPVNLPFQLEPYRLVVGAIVAVWLLSMLAGDVALRRSGLDAPMGLFVVAVFGSLLANPARFAAVQADALKSLTLFLSVVLVFYFIVTIVRTREDVEAITGLLVAGGAVVAILASVESRTGWSPFSHLQSYLPFLRQIGADFVLERGARFRAFGSAEHPIALGALLVLLVPPAFALALKRGAIWWVPLFALVVGAISTVSRTAVLMLLASTVVILICRWTEAKRYWFLVLPVLALTHFAVPGTLGALKTAFQPPGGLIAEQRSLPDSQSSAGRVADISPSLKEFKQQPLLGQGFGTRIVSGPHPNARILDNQWLGTLLLLGLAGVVGVAWLFIRFIRRLARLGRHDPTADGYLPTAFAASITAFAVGMFTYDAFAFTQVTLVAFVILALGSAYCLDHPGGDRRVRVVPARRVGVGRVAEEAFTANA